MTGQGEAIPLTRMVTKDKRALRLNVAVLVATLYGDAEGEKAALRWGVAAPTLKKA